MSGKISKTTSDQLKFSDAVEHATAQHGERIAEKASNLVWPDSTPPFSFVLIVRALLSLLRLAAKALRKADAAYMDELADDDPVRAERDEAARDLRVLLGNVRNTVIAAFGEAYARKVGLMGRLQDRPDMLKRRSRGIVRRMRREPLPTLLLDGVTVDIPILATRLEEHTNRLAAALTAVGIEKAEADAAFVAREQAAAHWQRVTRLVANFMIGLAEVAGEMELARRIRPTVRRLRGDIAPDELELEEDEEVIDLEDPSLDDPDPTPAGN